MTINSINKFIQDNNITHIYLDIDGVLFASCQACADILNEMQGTDFNGSDVLSWDFKNICPNITLEEIEDMFVSDLFFQQVQWIKGALEFIKQHRNNITIITHARTENFIQKRMFFNQYGLEDIPIIPIPIEMPKGIINMKCFYGKSLFIDDSTINLYSANSDFKIQFREYKDNKKRDWQENWFGDIMYEW